MKTRISNVVSIALCACLAGAAAAQEQYLRGPGPQPAWRYVVIPGPTLGGASGTAMGVNAAGQIAGSADTAQNLRHAMVWSLQNGIVDLEPGSDLASEASGINALGDVVGYRESSMFGHYQATLWTAGGLRWDLQAPAGVDSYALAINDRGCAVGTIGTSYSQGAYWNESQNLQLLSAPGNVSVAWDINGSGTIVGVAASQAGSWVAERAALWRVDPLTGLVSPAEFLGGVEIRISEARAINENGTVVGGMQRFNRTVAFISRPAASTGQRQMKEIASFGGASYSQAIDINNSGEVVGVFGLSQYPPVDHAFHWSSETGWVDLNDAIAEDFVNQWTLVQASSVNDRGEITGYGIYRGAFRAFLLLPVGPHHR